MTAVNSWPKHPGPRSGEIEREALVACDVCFPPRELTGSAAELRALGWSFSDLEAGPHRCPWCPSRRLGRGPYRRVRSSRVPALPNLLVIGAGRSGTTSLHAYLGLHPEINMSELKELRFLHLPGSLDRLDEYATMFDGRAPVRGESSPIYSVHPLAPGVPERIAKALPNVRLIYLVRDPVERAVSHYRAVLPRAPIDDALGEPRAPYNRFTAPGRYATQLEQYLAVFPPERILVVDHDEFVAERHTTMRRMFRFLGVEEGFVSPRFAEVSNAAAARYHPGRVGAILYRSRLAERIRRSLPRRAQAAIFRPVRRLTRRRFEAPTPSDEVRDALREAYRGEVERLRELTGQPFAGWQI